MASFERILVPTDFSAGSYAALGYAVFVAQRLGGIVEVLAVYETPSGIDPQSRITQPGSPKEDTLGNLLRRSTEEKLAKFLTDVPGAKGVELQRRIESGNAAEVIVRVAREDGIDLISMGTKGIGGEAKTSVGSVLAKVIRDAPCPVLAVRVKAA
jgi:nucleotide-binding universal stress UspA family protein